MKLILTGGAGLVGQNLIARLIPAGAWEIVVIDKHHSNLAVLRRLHPSVTAIDADLAVRGAWTEHFKGADAVVMLQAQIGGNEPEAFVRNNVAATRQVLDCMKENDVSHLVHISSSVVQSVANDDYTKTKRAQEEAVLESGVPTMVLRPTLMFGWFDRKHLGWLSRFMRTVPVFPIPGDGRYARQPLYVGDFCNIIIRCLETRRTGDVLNISGIERIDYLDIIRAIRKSVGARAAIIHVPVPVFQRLLDVWALFDANPPFTSAQLKALTARDSFEVIDWPGIFGVRATPFAEALDETFRDPKYSDVVLAF